MLAYSKGHKDVVKLLIDHLGCTNIDLNARSNMGFTALLLACEEGHNNVAQLLLHYSKRIDLNARCNNGGTAFIWACYFGQKDIVQLLLDHSDPTIELNARSNNGLTAFMWACRSGHKDVVKLLLNHSERIELNEKDNNGWHLCGPVFMETNTPRPIKH